MNNSSRPIGLWIITIFSIFLLITLIFGQTMAFVNYDFTVSLGLQEPVSEVTAMGVAVNKAFGIGDTLVYIPVLILGLVGLWQRKMFGLLTMFGALAVTAYWPIVCLSMLYLSKGIPGFEFNSYTSYSLMLGTISVCAVFGMVYIIKNRSTLVDN